MGLYFACKTFTVLPCAGGVLDQPAQLIEDLMGVEYAFKSHEYEETEKRIKKLEEERKSLKRGRHGR